MAVDDDFSNGMDIREFYEFFEFADTLYARRTYESINEEHNGVVPFRDFLVYIWRCCFGRMAP